MSEHVRTKWDLRFLQLAGVVAGWSKDPNKKVGAVVVSPDRRQVSYGYNGFPQRVEDSPTRLGDRTKKNLLTVHAELNALLNARVPVAGWTLYVTAPPCHDCAKAIIQAGVVRVVAPLAERGSSWFESCARAEDLFREADVRRRYLEL